MQKHQLVQSLQLEWKSLKRNESSKVLVCLLCNSSTVSYEQICLCHLSTNKNDPSQQLSIQRKSLNVGKSVGEKKNKNLTFHLPGWLLDNNSLLNSGQKGKDQHLCVPFRKTKKYCSYDIWGHNFVKRPIV